MTQNRRQKAKQISETRVDKATRPDQTRTLSPFTMPSSVPATTPAVDSEKRGRFYQNPHDNLCPRSDPPTPTEFCWCKCSRCFAHGACICSACTCRDHTAQALKA